MDEQQKKNQTSFEKIFKSILDSAPADAAEVKRDFKGENLYEKESQLMNRDIAYTDLADNFVYNYRQTHEQKRFLKNIFFWFIMPLYAIIILGSMFAVIASLFIAGSQIEVVLGAVASIITSVIAIPTIIAKYLFPIGEDKNMTKMVHKMQEYDNNIRTINKTSKKDDS